MQSRARAEQQTIYELISGEDDDDGLRKRLCTREFPPDVKEQAVLTAVRYDRPLCLQLLVQLVPDFPLMELAARVGNMYETWERAGAGEEIPETGVFQ